MVSVRFSFFRTSLAHCNTWAVFTKTWSNPQGMDPNTWAQSLTATVKAALSWPRTAVKTDENNDPLFGGVMAGGCCKAGPEYFRALRDECDKAGLL